MILGDLFWVIPFNYDIKYRQYTNSSLLMKCLLDPDYGVQPLIHFRFSVVVERRTALFS